MIYTVNNNVLFFYSLQFGSFDDYFRSYNGRVLRPKHDRVVNFFVFSQTINYSANKICQKNLIIFTTYSSSLCSLLSRTGRVDCQYIFLPPFHISIYSTSPNNSQPPVLWPTPSLLISLYSYFTLLHLTILSFFLLSTCVQTMAIYSLSFSPLCLFLQISFYTFYAFLILFHLVTPHTYTSAFSFLQISFLFPLSRINAQHSHPYVLVDPNNFIELFFHPYTTY